MANPNQSGKICILRVEIKCCSSCQKKATRNLRKISSVDTVEYNVEKELMTVTGDVNPMMLIHKLNKWGKNAEIVSVQNQISDEDDLTSNNENNSSDNNSITSQNLDSKPTKHHQIQTQENKKKKKKKTGLLKKCRLLSCFGNSKVKSFPMQNKNWQFPSSFENGFGLPFNNPASQWWQPPPMMYPPPLHSGGPPMMHYPHAPMSTMPYNMFPAAQPPPNQVYFQSRATNLPHMVNPTLHYQNHTNYSL